MTKKKYDTIVYVGRFQPVHMAHIEIIRRAAAMADNLVLIIGSAGEPRTYKNPFTVEERVRMLEDSAVNFIRATTHVYMEPVRNSMYNDQAWAVRVQEAVMKHTKHNARVAIIGHSKDESSFYLKMFPQWVHEEVELIEPLHATDIRDLYFKEDVNMRYFASVVPPAVQEFLGAFYYTGHFKQIVAEREFIAKYRKQFVGLPYDPTFVTADAVVIQSGHVLMIKRKAAPGAGLWAIPGGFLNARTDRSLQDAALRELREETGLKVPAPVLAGCIKDSRVFDAIERSARGRTITHAFKIVLPDGELPRVKGADDAEKAKWVPLSEIRGEDCFDDHYDIIQWAIGG